MEKKEFPTYIQPQSGRHRHTTMLQCLPNTWQALSISNVAFKQAGWQATVAHHTRNKCISKEMSGLAGNGWKALKMQ